MVTDGLTTTRTQKEDTAQPYGSDGNYTTTHANKTINALQQPERDHAKTAGYYEPTTMLLDHLAFSTKLTARAIAALAGPSKVFSNALLRSIAKENRIEGYGMLVS
jgi:hypothetical protein